MANQIEQLTTWLVNRANQQGLSIQQFKDIKFSQVRKNLPVNYRARLTQTLYLKAKRLALTQLFQEKLDELKNNTNVRQAILAVFPDATFRVYPHKRQIIIEVQ
ncbi:MAG: hypothetical protein OEV87_01170 [Phycisphaerae bacterium]|nr:hypothetical protein [Phycisphaerae bacterium]